MPLQMEQPGVVVHAVAQLHEGDEVGGAQFEFSLRTAEKETAIFRQLALRIFAQMSPMFALARLHLQQQRWRVDRAAPQQSVARFDLCERRFHHRQFVCLRELMQHLARLVAQDDDGIDCAQQGFCQQTRCDAHEQHAFELLRESDIRRLPVRRHHMMGFVDDQPVRTSRAGSQVAKPRKQCHEEPGALVELHAHEIDHRALLGLAQQLFALFDFRRMFGAAEHDGGFDAVVVAFGIDDAEGVLLLAQAFHETGGHGRFASAGSADDECVHAIRREVHGLALERLAQQDAMATQRWLA